MKTYRRKEVIKGKLIIEVENTYLPCPYDGKVKDCEFSQTERDYQKGRDVCFCLGVPDMEVCPMFGCGLFVNGVFKPFANRRAAKRMATLYRKQGCIVEKG